MNKFVDLKCSGCNREIIDAFCVIPDYPNCPDCGAKTERLFLPGSVPAIKGDDIPGGVLIKHGVCNPDGSPRKFYTKSEIAQAAKAKGLVNQPERGVADKKEWDRLSSNRFTNQEPRPKKITVS